MTTLDPEWLSWPQTRVLVQAFNVHPGAFRFVGGAVRDALLMREVKDVDAATTLLPEATMALLQQPGIRVVPTGLAHGTVTAVIGGKSFEITTLRRDIATDGRHAEVAFTDNWQADASRRDFTMNAMYLSPTGELFDFFGGVDDAQAGRVRFIGDAATRIGEDYLRILRFFRFYAHYGKGEPDEAALTACAAGASSIAALSGERVQHELFKLLQAQHCAPVLQWMHGHKLLPYVVGFDIVDGVIWERFEAIERLEHLAAPAFVRLAGFVCKATVGEEEALVRMSDRLRLSNHSENSIDTLLNYYHQLSPTMSVAEQKRMIRTLGEDDFAYAVVLNWANGNEALDSAHPYHAMLQLAEEWQPPLFPVSGDDLIARGLKPGRELGDVLRTLEEEWEASDYRLTKEELLAG